MLLIGFVITGCVSTTVFRTYPARADVYVSGVKKGKTPYFYSDRKIVASSTPVSFRKQGYYDLNIILKRNEELDLGPFIGGLFVWIPFLWVTKYDSLHAYQLVVDTSEVKTGSDSAVKEATTITEYNNIKILHDTIDSVSYPKNQVVYKEEKTGNLENDSLYYTEDTSSQKSRIKETPTFFGLGGGFCFPGSLWGVRYTFMWPSRWGGSIGLNSNIFKSDNVPPDYYDDDKRAFAPRDYVNSFAFNIVKDFRSPKESTRYGLEFGPSLVIYREAQFELNTGSTWPDYNYQKSHSRENALGLSIRAKMQFLFSNSSGLELAAFTNINSVRSVVGFEIDLILGRMGYTK